MGRLAVILLLLFPSVAGAARVEERVGRAMGEWVWGKPPCGKVKMTVDDFSRFGWSAHTYVGDCTIAFDRGWLWQQAARSTFDRVAAICTVTVHEWGHLHGRRHEDGGVMASPVPNDYAPCLWAAGLVTGS